MKSAVLYMIVWTACLFDYFLTGAVGPHGFNFGPPLSIYFLVFSFFWCFSPIFFRLRRKRKKKAIAERQA